MPIFEKRSRLPVSARVAFDWHARSGAFQRLTPPWEKVRLLEHVGGISNGGRAVIEARIAGPIKTRWVAVHEGFIDGQQFRDVQTSGPFKRWEHTHTFEPDGENASWLTDHIDYELPVGPLGALLGGSMVRKKLDRMFAYRHRITADDLQMHQAARSRPPMRIALSGTTGLIGSALAPMLTTGGHEVFRLIRGATTSKSGTIAWNPDTASIDHSALEGVDAIVHLGGVNLADKRWSPKFKATMLASRVNSTRVIAEAVARMTRRPSVLVCASAVGIYGDRGDEELTEKSRVGAGYVADLCEQWEAAAKPAIDAGVRVVFARFGLVLSPLGGPLAQLLGPMKMGAGGVIGNGSQYWSAIAIDDAIGAIHHMLVADTLHGPVNVVAPEATTNRELTRTLARVLHRPSFLRVPAPLARLALGEIADEILLSSAHVKPAALLASGYRFRFPQIEPAIRHLLGL